MDGKLYRSLAQNLHTLLDLFGGQATKADAQTTVMSVAVRKIRARQEMHAALLRHTEQLSRSHG